MTQELHSEKIDCRSGDRKKVMETVKLSLDLGDTKTDKHIVTVWFSRFINVLII